MLSYYIKVEELVDDVDLKQKIEAWVAERKASASGASAMQS